MNVVPTVLIVVVPLAVKLTPASTLAAVHAAGSLLVHVVCAFTELLGIMAKKTKPT